MNAEHFRIYTYCGPGELKQRLKRESHCLCVSSLTALQGWISAHLPAGCASGTATATFIVDLDGELWIADRHSEHVACADGGDVLAAGELVFEKTGPRLAVVEASNQSTGYCPEPDCWRALVAILDRLPVRHPGSFTSEFIFRHCGACGTTNIVKDACYECSMCGEPLPLSVQ